jgi:ABC-type transport system substrate-binding protein
MMMRSLFVFLAVLALASAFAPAPFAVLKTTTTTTGGRLAMFNAGEEGKTLEIAKGGEPASVAPSSATTTTTGEPKMLVKNLGFGKGGEVREVNFVDPAMMANTNPLLMNWWA